MTKRIPSKAEITPTTPLQLKVAAALAFPDGSMGASGLRREAARGRLAVERIASKDYTTLRAIEEMRERCRVQPREAACGSAQRGEARPAGSRTPPHGSSSTEASNIPLASAMLIADQLSALSPSRRRRP